MKRAGSFSSEINGSKLEMLNKILEFVTLANSDNNDQEMDSDKETFKMEYENETFYSNNLKCF